MSTQTLSDDALREKNLSRAAFTAFLRRNVECGAPLIDDTVRAIAGMIPSTRRYVVSAAWLACMVRSMANEALRLADVLVQDGLPCAAAHPGDARILCGEPDGHAARGTLHGATLTNGETVQWSDAETVGAQ